MNRIVKDTLIIFSITLISGLLLGIVYNVTIPARDHQKELALLKAYNEVMPGLTKSEDVDTNYDELSIKVNEEITDTEDENNISTIKEANVTIDNIAKAYDGDKVIGDIVTVTSNEAYDGTLKITVGIDASGKVNGIYFLELSETPGLGMKAKENDFISQFDGLTGSFIKYVKGEKKSDDEISAISSATITTNAVTHATDAAIIAVEITEGKADE